jgi:hypothetical protein
LTFSVDLFSRAKAAGSETSATCSGPTPAVDAEVAGARRDKDADDAAANAAAAAAADAKSKAAAAAARRVARGGIPLSSKWGAPRGVTPPVTPPQTAAPATCELSNVQAMLELRRTLSDPTLMEPGALLPSSPVTARRLHKRPRSLPPHAMPLPLLTNMRRANVVSRPPSPPVPHVRLGPRRMLDRSLPTSSVPFESQSPTKLAQLTLRSSASPRPSYTVRTPCATSNLPQPRPSLDLTLFVRDLTCTPVCRTVDTVPTTVNATLEPPRSEVTLLHLPNPLTMALGSPIVANSPPSSALLPVRAGLYAPQYCSVLACVARPLDLAARTFHTQAARRRHARSHVPGQGGEAYEHLPFMAAAAGGRYCPPCRRLTFPGKGAPGWCASQERHVAHTRTPRSLRLCSRRREREGRRAKTSRTSW